LKNMFRYETSIGPIGIAEEDGAITNLWFKVESEPGDAIEKETALLAEASKQLADYLQGNRGEFSMPLSPTGTPFMRKVWESLRGIPYGQTRSYGQIAKEISVPGAARAVGMANNRNPIAIFLPCHRVIGANGRLVGYFGGLDLKEDLLELERMNTQFHRTD
jgi:methylated-DNA-[protein]-cysteine S-methyltransferase